MFFGDQLHVIGGRGVLANPILDDFVFDVSEDAWTERADVMLGVNGGQRALAAAFSIGNAHYAFGGTNAGLALETAITTNRMVQLDVDTMTWSSISPTGLPTKRSSAAAAVCENGKAYMYGGWDSGSFTQFDELYEFDPAMDQFTELSTTGTTPGDVPTFRLYHAMSCHNNIVYMYGGQYYDTNFALVNVVTMHTFDTATNEWTDIGDLGLSANNRNPAMATLGGKIFILRNNDFVELDPADNSVRVIECSECPADLQYAGMVAAGDYIVIHGGLSNGAPVTNLLAYRPPSADGSLEERLVDLTNTQKNTPTAQHAHAIWAVGTQIATYGGFNEAASGAEDATHFLNLGYFVLQADAAGSNWKCNLRAAFDLTTKCNTAAFALRHFNLNADTRPHENALRMRLTAAAGVRATTETLEIRVPTELSGVGATLQCTVPIDAACLDINVDVESEYTVVRGLTLQGDNNKVTRTAPAVQITDQTRVEIVDARCVSSSTNFSVFQR